MESILKSVKKYPSLIPLFASVAFGVGGGIFYTLRCAIKSPDVTWNRTKNLEPWNEYKDKQYKFFATSQIKDAPPFEIPQY